MRPTPGGGDAAGLLKLDQARRTSEREPPAAGAAEELSSGGALAPRAMRTHAELGSGDGSGLATNADRG